MAASAGFFQVYRGGLEPFVLSGPEPSVCPAVSMSLLFLLDGICDE